MILVLSNAQDATATFFEMRLRERGVEYLRLDTECLPEYELGYVVDSGVPTATLRAHARTVSMDSVTSICNRRMKISHFWRMKMSHLDRWSGLGTAARG